MPLSRPQIMILLIVVSSVLIMYGFLKSPFLSREVINGQHGRGFTLGFTVSPWLLAGILMGILAMVYHRKSS